MKYSKTRESVYKETGRAKWLGNSFSLLKVSSAVRKEALATLFRRGEFVWISPVYGVRIQPHDIPFLDGILNICFSTCFDPNSLRSMLLFDQDDERIFGRREAHSLSCFIGDKTARDTCSFEINFTSQEKPDTNGEVKPPIRDLLRLPGIDFLSQLTGFKTLEVRTRYFLHENFTSISRLVDEKDYDFDIEASIKAIAATLEPSLGPTTFKKGQLSERIIVFQPRAYLASKKD
ncbi:hypothetical protein ACLMJK_004278 [Lecanora helva]